MAATQTAPSFETVWAILQEVGRKQEQLAESQKEGAEAMKALRESQKETDRQMKETDRRLKETEKLVNSNGKQIGGLHNSFGELAEHLVAPGIARRFNELGFHFDTIAPGGIKITNEKGDKTLAEIDLLLENSETIIGIEVKSRVVEDDIKHHIKRLKIFKENREKKREKPKKILGAIAGAIFGSVEKKATLEAGFYVLEQSGDTMKMDIPGDFVPREW